MSQIQDPSNGAGAEDGRDDAGFDQLLRGALRARPEPQIPFDLAGRAMRIAKARQAAQLQARTKRMAQQRWWAQVTGLAATILIGAMLAGAIHRLWTRGDITSMVSSVSSSDSDSTSQTASTDGGTSSSASTTSSTGVIASVLVGELLLIGMLLASLSRSGPTGPWTSEAVAGLC